MLFLDWPSDGIVARFALVLYGVIFLLFVLSRVRLNRVLARLLPAALLWHLVVWAFTAFWMVPYYAAATGADCYGYHVNGTAIAGLIRSGDWGSIPWGWNTAAMEIVTGVLYAPLGGDIYGMLFFSAIVGLCGALYFCLAFSLWVKPAQVRTYVLLVLFLPSFATWTGLLGKDSWIALGLGLACYGYSALLKARRGAGLRHLLAGVAITAAIRPHIAVALTASMALAYVWGLTRTRHLSIPAKVRMAAMLVAMVTVLAYVARGFLGLSDVSVDSLQEYGAARSAGNAVGGSAVEVQAAPGVVGTLSAFPRGIVRVLLQPFPWEIHNVNAGMASAENLFILWFALSHAKRLRWLIRGMVREPYVLFSSILAGGLLLILSLTPNLGLLSRQRTQLLPSVFAPLVAADAVRKRGARPGRFTLYAGPPYRPGRPPAGFQPAVSSTPWSH